jgi:hypothetical protein
MSCRRNRISLNFFALPARLLLSLKGSVGLTLDTVSGMGVSIPLDLSSRSFMPLPRFIRSRRPTPLLAQNPALQGVLETS